MSDPTFEALLNHYQERGQRILDLEELCRDMYRKLRLSAELPATFSDLHITETRMKSLGLLGDDQ